MLCGKTGENGWEGPVAAQSATGEQWYCASLVFPGFYSYPSLLFTTAIIIIVIFNFISVIELFLSQTMSFNFFPSFLPYPTEWGSEQQCGT